MYIGFVTTHLQIGGVEPPLREVAPCVVHPEDVATASSAPGGSNLPGFVTDADQPPAGTIAVDRRATDQPTADLPDGSRGLETDGTDVAAAPTPGEHGEGEPPVARRRGVV